MICISPFVKHLDLSTALFCIINTRCSLFIWTWNKGKMKTWSHSSLPRRPWSPPSKWGLLGPCESNWPPGLLRWRQARRGDHVLRLHEAGIHAHAGTLLQTCRKWNAKEWNATIKCRGGCCGRKLPFPLYKLINVISSFFHVSPFLKSDFGTGGGCILRLGILLHG